MERFIRYAQIDTQSSGDSSITPSTHSQFDLANLLVSELKEFGILDAEVDQNCYVMATLPANCDFNTGIVGLIAHLDTSPSVSGKDVKPQIIESYQGGDLCLNKEAAIFLKESECAELSGCKGHTLIVTDGTTLLGADDKAGVTAIMASIEYLIKNPHIKHGTVKIAFTPDEEIGKGADFFDIQKFGAQYACTVDGGFAGELNKETFSADEAIIEVYGRDIHPGTAKNIMINSIRSIAEIIAMLPPSMAPEHTENYEPFIHPLYLQGGVSHSTLKLILRDFKTDGLKIQRQILENIIADVQHKYSGVSITLKVNETYRNMRDALDKNPHVTERLWNAAEKAGVSPFWSPIRGGTDGARLTASGLPTPNMFTGSGNHHSVTEWLSVDALQKAVETIVNFVSVGN
ncbi:MAG: peptidase T [Fibrobacter sp.]|nr:peptidase T [Fibrobacter sp.]